MESSSLAADELVAEVPSLMAAHRACADLSQINNPSPALILTAVLLSA
jgi:hypothetical protein